MKKNIAAFFVTVTAIIFVIQPVFAITTTPTLKSTAAATRMANLKSRATNEISRRVAALNTESVRINAAKKLSSTDKDSLTAELQQEISALTTLKTKIEADTDLATLNVDVKSIVDAYRIFLLELPKIRIIVNADLMSVNADKLSDLAAALNIKIQEAQAKGVDISAMQTRYNDMLSKIADANTQYQNVENAVIPLTPADYPANKSTLTNSRDKLLQGRNDLKAALEDAKSIRALLKK